jgi:hypothetical protein
MRIFREYHMDKKSFSNQIIYMPKEADVVSVQNTDTGLTLLALVDYMANSTEIRKFKICLRDEVLYTDNVKYIGNFKGDLGINYVIEILEDDV